MWASLSFSKRGVTHFSPKLEFKNKIVTTEVKLIKVVREQTRELTDDLHDFLDYV